MVTYGEKEKRNREMVRLFVEQNKTSVELADRYGVSPQRVRELLAKYGVSAEEIREERRGPGRPHQPSVRLSAAERQLIEEAVDVSGTPLATFIRDAALVLARSGWPKDQRTVRTGNGNRGPGPSVRVSAEEREQIYGAAEKAGVPPTTFMREAAIIRARGVVGHRERTRKAKEKQS